MLHPTLVCSEEKALCSGYFFPLSKNSFDSIKDYLWKKEQPEFKINGGFIPKCLHGRKL